MGSWKSAVKVILLDLYINFDDYFSIILMLYHLIVSNDEMSCPYTRQQQFLILP